MRLLEDKVVLVSGLGPGLGAQVARAAAAHGAAVVLGARTETALTDMADEIARAGGRVAYARCDITSDDDCRALVARAVDAFGGIDCLVNNAYLTGPMGPTAAEVSFEEWQATLDVNLFGSVRLVRHALGAMEGRPDPSVVCVSSHIVRRVVSGLTPYATSKAALMTAVQILAKELGPRGVRVNTVVAGVMWGPPFQNHLQRLADAAGTTLDEAYRARAQDFPLRRIPTDAECAGAVIFLASELARAVTGQSIDANGGEEFHW